MPRSEQGGHSGTNLKYAAMRTLPVHRCAPLLSSVESRPPIYKKDTLAYSIDRPARLMTHRTYPSGNAFLAPPFTTTPSELRSNLQPLIHLGT